MFLTSYAFLNVYIGYVLEITSIQRAFKRFKTFIGQYNYRITISAYNSVFKDDYKFTMFAPTAGVIYGL